MNIYIPLLISIFVVFASRYNKFIRYIAVVVTYFILILMFLFIAHKDNLIRLIPLTHIDNSRITILDNSGNFYLKRGVEPSSAKRYTINDSTDYANLQDYLNESDKNVYAYISNNGQLVYSECLGQSNMQDGIEILSTYYSWRAYNILPKTTTRYSFLIFFMDT